MSESSASAQPATSADHGHGHDHAHHEDWGKHIRTYMYVGGTLLLFTLITVLVAYYVDLQSRAANITLGLAIAAFKCSLVALIFMHLKNERKIIYKVLLFTAIFFAGMMFLILLTQSDPIPVK